MQSSEDQIKKEDDQDPLPHQFLRRHNLQAQKSDAEGGSNNVEVTIINSFVIACSSLLDVIRNSRVFYWKENFCCAYMNTLFDVKILFWYIDDLFPWPVNMGLRVTFPAWVVHLIYGIMFKIPGLETICFWSYTRAMFSLLTWSWHLVLI